MICRSFHFFKCRYRNNYNIFIHPLTNYHLLWHEAIISNMVKINPELLRWQVFNIHGTNTIGFLQPNTIKSLRWLRIKTSSIYIWCSIKSRPIQGTYITANKTWIKAIACQVFYML